MPMRKVNTCWLAVKMEDIIIQIIKVMPERTVLNHSNETIYEASVLEQSHIVPARHSKKTKSVTLSRAPQGEEVAIPKSDAPLVVLFGPHACGKTMTMVRLLRFLIGEGYDVKPVKTFSHVSGVAYANVCKWFYNILNSDFALPATDREHSMVVEVADNSLVVCHILDASGFYYFNEYNPCAPLSDFMNTIINSPNRKVWTIMIEPLYMGDSERIHYATDVARLKQYLRPTDRVIFLFNKIDLTCIVRGIGVVDKTIAFKMAEEQYPNMFVPFKNTCWLTRLFRKYSFDFVPFQAGCFTQTYDRKTYHEGPKEYCANLWKSIIKQ